VITSVLAENFQVHESTLLKLSPTVTTIVGDSDQGKSSLVRLLKWVLFNRPLTDSFVTHGRDKARGVVVTDGHEVVRERGKGVNRYILDGNELKAFKFDVPDEVSSLFNVSDANFAGQHDPVFWFLKTPGEVSRELNSVVNLAMIDGVLASLASEVRATKAVVSECETRLEEARSRKKELAWVPDCRKQHEELLGLREACERHEKDTRALRECCAKAAAARVLLCEGSEVLALGRGALKAIEVLRDHEKKTYELRQVIDRIKTLRSEWKRLDKEYKRAGADLKKRLGDRCPLCGSETKSRG
jgi:hypothetical protein